MIDFHNFTIKNRFFIGNVSSVIDNFTFEEAVRDHLRGGSRTIPSFLMAYGDEEITLSTFDMIIPDDVFYEVTSITLDQFRFLRDGGSYTDADTGEEKRYPGKLFDPVVFDDSIKEFLSLRTRLGNYFDESHKEDIFRLHSAAEDQSDIHAQAYRKANGRYA